MQIEILGGLASDEAKVYSEEDWTNTETDSSVPTYQKAKTLAEKAAWDFVKDLKGELQTVRAIRARG